jgi:biotin carboxyl carrier protein
MKKLRITVDGKTYDVEVELLDSEVATKPVTSGTAPQTVAAPLASSPAPVPTVASAPRPVAGPGAVASPLAGKVAAVHVAVGQQVAEGAQLVTLEAMKMNTFVYAESGGTVSQVLVAVGDGVEEGQPLVHIS